MIVYRHGLATLAFAAALILAPLGKRHPRMKLVLSEEMTETLLRRLHDHEIDAALLSTGTGEQDL